MKKLVLGVMLMVVPLVSSATDWYIFVSQNHECVSSARASDSPAEAFESGYTRVG